MCGIIGYVGGREAKPLLLQGLRRLEYRGYDSAGIALREDAGLDYVRAGENFLASNVAAFLSETKRAVFPDDGEVVEITPAAVRFFKDGTEVEHPAVEELDWDNEAAEKGGYETYMLKEIYEQPEA